MQCITKLKTPMVCAGSSQIDGNGRRLTTHRQSKGTHWSIHIWKWRISAGFGQSFIQCLLTRAPRHVFDRLLLDSKKRGVNPTWQFCGTRSYQTFSQYINSGISWTLVLKCILGSDLKRSRPVNLWSLQQQFDPDNFAPLTWWLTHPQTYCGDLDGIDSSYWAPNRSAVTVVSPPSLCQLQFPTVILAGTW